MYLHLDEGKKIYSQSEKEDYVRKNLVQLMLGI